MKHYSKLITFCVLLFVALGCKNEAVKHNAYQVKTQKDANGFNYETVANDPTGLRLYTLDNGLTVYLSKNADEPKIQTYIAVRAGSNYDPKESTGLAHYLEHMVFKGTSKIGTSDWEKERVYLDQISDLYEQHKAETDPELKKELYKKIDEVSLEASQYAVANEYDKMTSTIGAEGTNAHTWFEETVYQNMIPANELNKWLTLESERMSELVLRLFHTELEAVFEEFNRGQDSDGRKAYAALLDGLFPTHPYGQQTTIGIGEHLKNPSMVAIHNYFDTYYVPNNMAIVLVGDIDFEETIKNVNDAFGKFERKELVHPTFEKEAPITSPIVREVFGPTSENIMIGFRSGGVNTKDEKMVTLVDMILANGSAGLIDLNLNQKQLVQGAGSSSMFLNDYGFHTLYGSPKEGQTLDEVKDLILGQLEVLKNGEFEDWMIEAVVNDLKLSQMRSYDNSTALATEFYNAYIHHENWKDKLNFLDELKAVTKEELVAYVKEHYKDNYVVTYKRKGIDKTIVKVENPGITPIHLNRDKNSEYLTTFNAMEVEDLKPLYIDYKEEIKTSELSNGIEVSYIENESNDLFNLYFIFDMGSNNDKKLALAVNYFQYLGTNTLNSEEVKKEFYKLGVNYFVSTGADKSYVGLSGLKENLPQGLELLMDLWNNAEADQEAYDNLIDKIAKGRDNGKTQKENILYGGLMNYGKYGENSPLRNIIQIEEMKSYNPQELVELVKDLKNFKQRIFYYGKDLKSAESALNSNYTVAKSLKDYPEAVVYEELDIDNNVYFVNYDMVQSEVLYMSKAKEFDAKDIAAKSLFNSYFGGGLSSIIFQEIRESKSLAYSAYASYATASEQGKHNYVMAYIGTQANKMAQASEAMMSLMNEMPEAQEQFMSAKEATLKKIAAERITKSDIFWSYEGLKKLGIDNDNREEIYNTIQNMSIQDLAKFFNENIKGRTYNVMVIGNKNDIDPKVLKSLGTVKEMDIDYLFNYVN